MTDRVAELILAAAVECGVLAVAVLWREFDALAGGRAFTASEVCAHACVPGNVRLRAVIEAVCFEVSARKLGRAAGLRGRPARRGGYRQVRDRGGGELTFRWNRAPLTGRWRAFTLGADAVASAGG